MRKLLISAAGAVVLLAATAAVGTAGAGPRLEGVFNVTGTVTATDIKGLSPGSKTKDTYTFKPKCAAGGCAKVKLIRASGTRNVKSTLRKVKPGVYKGKEGPVAYTCIDPLGAPGQFTGRNKVRVTKSANGHATRIAGTSKIQFTGCNETFENTSIKGKLK